MLSDIAPMGRGLGEVDSGFAKNFLHLRYGHPHQAGIPIGTAALVIDPIGAQVAFFKNMNPQPQALGQLYGFGMYGTCLSI
tara:strand:+ start:184 stop:426 length:243 start_codon:yes stop_codon:yes gene_type:complete